MKRNNLLFILIITFILIPTIFAIPQTLNFYGRLTNSSGNALSGTYTIRFKIYNSSTGGNALWDSGNMNVTTDSNGVYNVVLKNINLTFDEQYYLGVTVEDDSEMTPRINLTSTPYTFRANVTDFLDKTKNYEMQNLTLGQKITFALGEVVDNLVDNWIRITGNLNVTRNTNVLGNITASNFFGNLNWSYIQNFPESSLNVNSSNYWDGLDSPSDISTSDLTDDNTYVQVIGDTMTGNLNLSNNNITNVHTGFFSYLGSLVNRIAKLFVLDINASGNVNVGGNITASNLFGNLNWSYIQNSPNFALNSSLSNYYLKSNPFGFYNSSDFVISDYYLKSNPYNYYNSTTIPSYARLDANNVFGAYNQTFATNALFINGNTGNVGIGTTNPNTKLDVNGNITVNNTLCFTSNCNARIYYNSTGSEIIIEVT